MSYLLMKKNYEEIVFILEKYNFQKRIDKLAKKYNNRKIVIYGAGILFNAIVDKYDLSALNIVGIADKSHDLKNIEFCRGYKALGFQSFINEKPDIVLISTITTDIIEDYFQRIFVNEKHKFKIEPIWQLDFKDVIKELIFRRKPYNLPLSSSK